MGASATQFLQRPRCHLREFPPAPRWRRCRTPLPSPLRICRPPKQRVTGSLAFSAGRLPPGVGQRAIWITPVDPAHRSGAPDPTGRDALRAARRFYRIRAFAILRPPDTHRGPASHCTAYWAHPRVTVASMPASVKSWGCHGSIAFCAPSDGPLGGDTSKSNATSISGSRDSVAILPSAGQLNEENDTTNGGFPAILTKTTSYVILTSQSLGSVGNQAERRHAGGVSLRDLPNEPDPGNAGVGRRHTWSGHGECSIVRPSPARGGLFVSLVP